MHDAMVTLAEPNPWIDLVMFAFIGLGWILSILLEEGLTEPSGKHKEGEH